MGKAVKKTDSIVRSILPEIEGKEVLEVACGAADFSLSASPYARKITCIDLDEKRLDPLVREQENICFRVMDAAQMTFEKDTFDTIILYNALYHIKDQYDAILAECRRVLKPEGHIFLIATWKMDLSLMREIWKRLGTDGAPDQTGTAEEIGMIRLAKQ